MALQLDRPARIHHLSLPPAPRTSSLASSIHIDFPSCPPDRAEIPSEKSPADYVPSAGFVAPKRKPASHMAPTQFTCRLCHKSFQTSRALNGHTRVHGGHGTSDASYYPDGYGYTSFAHGKLAELKKTKHSLLLQNPNYVHGLLAQDCYTQERCYSQKESSSGKVYMEEEKEEEKQAEQKGAGEEFSEAEEDAEIAGGEGEDAGDAQFFQPHGDDAKGESTQHALAGEGEADVHDTKTPTQIGKGHIRIRLKMSAHTSLSLEEDLGAMSRLQQKKAKLMDVQTLKRRALCALRHNPKQSRVLTDEDFELVETKKSQTAPREEGGSEGGSDPTSVPTNMLPRHHVCTTCARAFQSWKALHGHMRCHNSEKGWLRGNLPPGIPASKETLFVVQSDKLKGSCKLDLAAHDLLIDQRSSAALADFDDQLGALRAPGIDIDFPTQLEKEKMEKPSFSTHAASKKMEIWRPHSPNCLPQKRFPPMISREEASGRYFTDEPCRTILEERYGNSSPEVVEAALVLYMIATTPAAPLPSSNVRLKLKDVEHEQRKEETTAHPCKLCDKVFSSPQALGGHTGASHKRPPKEERIRTIGRPQHDEAGAEEHRCTTCNVSFRSGQALGGHKRAHWSGPDKVSIDDEQVQLPQQDKQTNIAMKPMKVSRDLDLPAPLEADVGEYGYGRESSFAAPMELEEHDYIGYDDQGSPSFSLEKLANKQTEGDCMSVQGATYAMGNGLNSSKITCKAEDLGLKCTN